MFGTSPGSAIVQYPEISLRSAAGVYSIFVAGGHYCRCLILLHTEYRNFGGANSTRIPTFRVVRVSHIQEVDSGEFILCRVCICFWSNLRFFCEQIVLKARITRFMNDDE